MKCPNCKLINPDTALRCDCESEAMEENAGKRKGKKKSHAVGHVIERGDR